MDQEHGAGHHEITREAVHELFASGRAVEGEDGVVRINGMDEATYFQRLDQAQQDQDISIPLGEEGIPTYGTAVPAAWDGDVQREHSMADPDRSGEENLVRDRDYVEGEMHEAHAGGDSEFTHLGNASHALEDSYSQAHVWRDREGLAEGDPTAAIDSINVWDPIPGWNDGPVGKGLSDEQGTHDERFDHVEVNPDTGVTMDNDLPGAEGEHHLVHGGDRAAAHAIAEMLEAHEDGRGLSEAQARDRVDSTVDQFFQADDDGVQINREATPEWRAERDERLDETLGHPHELDTAEQIRAGIHAVEQAASDAVDWVSQTASDAYDATSHAVSEAADWVSETATEAYDATSHAVSEAADWVSETATEAYDSASSAVSSAANSVAETASEAYDAASNAVDSAEDALSDAWHSLVD
jgi:hypothetical protein